MIRSWLAAALGSIFLAGTTTGAGLPRNDRQPENRPPASSTRPFLEGRASTTPASQPVDIACVGAAVAARETALITASAAETQTVAGAYTTRASALQAAYSATDAKVVRGQVKAAWDTFGTTVKGAKKTWQTGRENAWKTFRAAAKVCKGGESISDTSSQGLEQQSI